MLDQRFLVMLNLVFQAALIAVLAGAVYLAREKKFKQHCMVTRAAFFVQIVLIAGIMLAPMDVYLKVPIFAWEVLSHHILGLIAIALWVYINLVFMKKIKPVLLKSGLAMRLDMAAWTLALVLGLHIFSRLYL